MKRYQSRFLKTIAWLYLGFPVVYLLTAPVIFDFEIQLIPRLLFSPFIYAVGFWAMLGGYGLLEMKRWAWHVFVFSNFLIFFFNLFVVIHYAEHHHKYLIFIAYTAALALFVYRATREIRVPYFFPKIRWWESDPRYKVSVPCFVVRRGGEESSGQIMDISMGGCFVKLKDDIGEEEVVHIRFSALGTEISCAGVVVWRTQSSVTHPKGVGVKFSPIGKQDRGKIRELIKKVRNTLNPQKRVQGVLNG